MTEQEEIREGVAERLFYFRWAGDGWWRNQSDDRKNLCRSYADDFLTYLHSQGVVIMVDERLPFSDPYGTCIAEINALNILIDAGYKKVKPLIEED